MGRWKVEPGLSAGKGLAPRPFCSEPSILCRQGKGGGRRVRPDLPRRLRPLQPCPACAPARSHIPIASPSGHSRDTRGHPGRTAPAHVSLPRAIRVRDPRVGSHLPLSDSAPGTVPGASEMLGRHGPREGPAAGGWVSPLPGRPGADSPWRPPASPGPGHTAPTVPGRREGRCLGPHRRLVPGRAKVLTGSGASGIAPRAWGTAPTGTVHPAPARVTWAPAPRHKGRPVVRASRVSALSVPVQAGL